MSQPKLILGRLDEEAPLNQTVATEEVRAPGSLAPIGGRPEVQPGVAEKYSPVALVMLLWLARNARLFVIRCNFVSRCAVLVRRADEFLLLVGDSPKIALARRENGLISPPASEAQLVEVIGAAVRLMREIDLMD